MKNVKKYYAECTTNLVQSVDSKNKSCFHDDVIKIENFSSLKKFFPVSCLVLQVLRFVKNSLANLQSDEENIIEDVICFDEISGAKYFWLSDQQKKVLKSTKFSELKKYLCLFRDENCLLRLKVRLGNVECTKYFKHPIFIPNDTYFTKLLIRNCQIQVLHSELNFMLNYIQNPYSKDVKPRNKL